MHVITFIHYLKQQSTKPARVADLMDVTTHAGRTFLNMRVVAHTNVGRGQARSLFSAWCTAAPGGLHMDAVMLGRVRGGYVVCPGSA